MQQGWTGPNALPLVGPPANSRSREGARGPPQGPVLGLHSNGRRCLPGQEAVSWQGWQHAEEGTHPKPCCHRKLHNFVDLAGLLGVLCPCGLRDPGWTPGSVQLPQEVDRQAPSGTHSLSATTEPHQQEAGWFHPSGLVPACYGQGCPDTKVTPRQAQMDGATATVRLRLWHWLWVPYLSTSLWEAEVDQVHQGSQVFQDREPAQNQLKSPKNCGHCGSMVGMFPLSACCHPAAWPRLLRPGHYYEAGPSPVISERVLETVRSVSLSGDEPHNFLTSQLHGYQ